MNDMDVAYISTKMCVHLYFLPYLPWLHKIANPPRKVDKLRTEVDKVKR
jgi:hypothetical protein